MTGTITAPDEILVYDDFYEGLLNSDFQWNGDNGWAVDPVDKSTYDYGYMLGPLDFMGNKLVTMVRIFFILFSFSFIEANDDSVTTIDRK